MHGPVRFGRFQVTYLVPDKVWVVANFKETQTANIWIGDPAHFTVDGANGVNRHRSSAPILTINLCNS